MRVLDASTATNVTLVMNRYTERLVDGGFSKVVLGCICHFYRPTPPHGRVGRLFILVIMWSDNDGTMQHFFLCDKRWIAKSVYLIAFCLRIAYDFLHLINGSVHFRPSMYVRLQ